MMRSDRSPYFLYKNHKDPVIRELLDRAAQMTDQEIDACVTKPDVKKAMRFVKQFGHQDRSAAVKDIVADRMQASFTPVIVAIGDIYLYKGPVLELPIKTTGRRLKHSWMVQDDVFMHVNGQIWINHTWCDPVDLLWSYSEKMGTGDLNTYNQIVHNYLNQKHVVL